MADVTIWGTVAAWVGAAATSASFMAAAGYYITDNKRESKRQASKVRLFVKIEGPQLLAQIANLSDAPIYAVQVDARPRSILKVLNDHKVTSRVFGEMRQATQEEWPKIAEIWKRLPAYASADHFFDLMTLKGGDEQEIEFELKNTEFYDFYVLFKDAQARWWQLDLPVWMGEPIYPTAKPYNPRYFTRWWQLKRRWKNWRINGPTRRREAVAKSWAKKYLERKV